MKDREQKLAAAKLKLQRFQKTRSSTSSLGTSSSSSSSVDLIRDETEQFLKDSEAAQPDLIHHYAPVHAGLALSTSLPSLETKLVSQEENSQERTGVSIVSTIKNSGRSRTVSPNRTSPTRVTPTNAHVRRSSASRVSNDDAYMSHEDLQTQNSFLKTSLSTLSNENVALLSRLNEIELEHEPSRAKLRGLEEEARIRDDQLRILQAEIAFRDESNQQLTLRVLELEKLLVKNEAETNCTDQCAVIDGSKLPTEAVSVTTQPLPVVSQYEAAISSESVTLEDLKNQLEENEHRFTDAVVKWQNLEEEKTVLVTESEKLLDQKLNLERRCEDAQVKLQRALDDVEALKKQVEEMKEVAANSGQKSLKEDNKGLVDGQEMVFDQNLSPEMWNNEAQANHRTTSLDIETRKKQMEAAISRETDSRQMLEEENLRLVVENEKLLDQQLILELRNEEAQTKLQSSLDYVETLKNQLEEMRGSSLALRDLNAALEQEREMLSGEIASLKEAGKTIVADRLMLEEEADMLATQLDDVSAKLETILAEKLGLEEKLLQYEADQTNVLEALRTEKAFAENLKKLARETEEKFSFDTQHLVDSLRELTESRTALKTELKSMSAENEGLLKNLRTVNEALTMTSAEMEKLNAKVSSDASHISHLEGELAVKSDEINQLSNRVREMEVLYTEAENNRRDKDDLELRYAELHALLEETRSQLVEAEARYDDLFAAGEKHTIELTTELDGIYAEKDAVLEDNTALKEELGVMREKLDQATSQLADHLNAYHQLVAERDSSLARSEELLEEMKIMEERLMEQREIDSTSIRSHFEKIATLEESLRNCKEHINVIECERDSAKDKCRELNFEVDELSEKLAFMERDLEIKTCDSERTAVLQRQYEDLKRSFAETESECDKARSERNELLSESQNLKDAFHCLESDIALVKTDLLTAQDEINSLQKLRSEDQDKMKSLQDRLEDINSEHSRTLSTQREHLMLALNQVELERENEASKVYLLENETHNLREQLEASLQECKDYRARLEESAAEYASLSTGLSEKEEMLQVLDQHLRDCKQEIEKSSDEAQAKIQTLEIERDQMSSRCKELELEGNLRVEEFNSRVQTLALEGKLRTEQSEGHIRKLERETRDLKARLESSEASLNELQVLLDDTTSKLNHSQRRQNEMNSEKSVSESLVNELQSIIDRLQIQLEDLSNKSVHLTSQLESTTEECRQTQLALLSAEKKIRELQSHDEQLKAELDEAVDLAESRRNQIVDLDTLVKHLKRENSDLRVALEQNTTNWESREETLLLEIGALNDQVSHYKKAALDSSSEVGKIKLDLDSAQAKLDTLTREMNSVTSKLKEKDLLISSMRSDLIRLGSIDRELGSLENIDAFITDDSLVCADSLAKSLHSTTPELNHRLAALTSERNEAREEVTLLKAELDRALKQSKSLEVDIKSLSLALAEATRSQSKVQSEIASKTNLEEKVQELECIIDQTQPFIQELEEKSRMVKELQNEVERLRSQTRTQPDSVEHTRASVPEVNICYNQVENAHTLLREHAEEIQVLKEVIESITGHMGSGLPATESQAFKLLQRQVDELKRVWSHEVSANTILRNLIAKTQTDSMVAEENAVRIQIRLQEEYDELVGIVEEAHREASTHGEEAATLSKRLREAERQLEEQLNRQFFDLEQQHQEQTQQLEDMYNKERSALNKLISNLEKERDRLVSELAKVKSSLSERLALSSEAADEASRRVADIERVKEDLRRQNSLLKDDVAKLQSDIDRLQIQVHDGPGDTGRASTRITALERLIEELTTQKRGLEDRLSSVDRWLEERIAVMNKMAELEDRDRSNVETIRDLEARLQRKDRLMNDERREVELRFERRERSLVDEIKHIQRRLSERETELANERRINDARFGDGENRMEQTVKMFRTQNDNLQHALAQRDTQIQSLEYRLQEILQSEGELVHIDEVRRRESDLQRELQLSIDKVRHLSNQLAMKEGALREVDSQYSQEKERCRRLNIRLEDLKRRLAQDEAVNSNLRPSTRNGVNVEDRLRDEINQLRRELVSARQSTAEVIAVIRETLSNTMGEASIEVHDGRSPRPRVDMSRVRDQMGTLISEVIYLRALVNRLLLWRADLKYQKVYLSMRVSDLQASQEDALSVIQDIGGRAGLPVGEDLPPIRKLRRCVNLMIAVYRMMLLARDWQDIIQTGREYFIAETNESSASESRPYESEGFKFNAPPSSSRRRRQADESDASARQSESSTIMWKSGKIDREIGKDHDVRGDSDLGGRGNKPTQQRSSRSSWKDRNSEPRWVEPVARSPGSPQKFGGHGRAP